MANLFSFTPASIEEVIESFDLKKAPQENDIHTNILKQNSAFFAFYARKNINAYISAIKIPVDLKEANIMPVCKKNRSYLKKTIGQ